MKIRAISPRMSIIPTTMKSLIIFFLLALFLAPGTFGRKGFGPGEQEWGYVEVRPKAQMFWWLYYTTADVTSYYEKPLVIWLQGGPGGSSTSFGNFEELGPLDVNLKARNYTWVKDYNVLFIDNPVGTGFSYTTSLSGYTTTNAQIADDLLECIRGFLKELPKFADVPTYITTESYGGKMGAEFALVWYKEQKAGGIKSNLKGVALGDAWISPIDSVMTWAPFLLATGMVDTAGYNEINKAAEMTKAAVDSKQWIKATSLWAYTENVILRVTDNIDFYNILTKMEARSFHRYSLPEFMSKFVSNPNEVMKDTFRKYVQYSELSLDDLMNGPVKKSLGLKVDHGTQSRVVFNRLMEDFMKPVLDKVELLLNETDLKVVVLTGHMDLIVDTPGTLLWVEKLKWKYATGWLNSDRLPLVADGIIEGYVKSHRNLAMYWLNRAGHMVPRDNPPGMAIILEDLTNDV